MSRGKLWFTERQSPYAGLTGVPLGLAMLLTQWLGCQPPTPPSEHFEASVNHDITPSQTAITGVDGKPQTVGSSRDADGVKSDFVIGVVRLKRVTQEQLNSFLSRYGGTVIGDDSLPQPPAGSGITLTEEQRKPTEFVVRIDLSRVDTSSFTANAQAAGLTGTMEFSSQEALQTIAAVLDALAAGLKASADYVLAEDQNPVFPSPFLATQEGKDVNNNTINAFNVSSFGAAGSQSNITRAWQFLVAHGINRRVKVAIVDNGFWLDPQGQAIIPDTDFPLPPTVIAQRDFVDDDAIARGTPCSEEGRQSACWHGSKMAGVAAGLLNNGGGVAGTGGLVADLLLLRFNLTTSQFHTAVRFAVASGADVVSMSVSWECDFACQVSATVDSPFDDAFNTGSKTVFVSSAGNDNAYVGLTGARFPCSMDHVICVGALADDDIIKRSTSNFGEAVSLFAPSGIPVMKLPDDDDFDINGTPSPQVATGSSGATAFVAGVAGMIKAMNPDLDSDQVDVILRETGHVGEGFVSRYLDAYAALRRVAQGVPAIKDRLDDQAVNNDLDTTPTDLSLPDFGGPSDSYDLKNLNLDRIGERDYFKFQAPANSTATVELEFPATLGELTIINAQTSGNCTPPVLTSTQSPDANKRRFVYRLGGGTYQFGVAGPDINAYNLSIVLAASAVEADIYESPPPNDLPENARLIQSVKPTGGGAISFVINPSVTIHPTLHTDTDVDWYLVRGARLSLADVVYMNGSPAVTLYGNDAPITLEVFARNDNNTLGTRVDIKTGLSCTAQPLVIPVTKDVYYFVKVTGSAGRYVLHNGIAGEKRLLPILVQDRAYEVLHPLDPIIKVLQQPEFFVFVADPAAYPNIIASGPPLHMRLFDIGGNLISEGQVQGAGERINLAGTTPNTVYALEVSPLSVTAGQPDLDIAFEAAAPVRDSGNLVLNGDAEALSGPDPEQVIFYWSSTGAPETRLYGEPGFPSVSDPGPPQRGARLLAGGGNTLSTLRQIVNFDPSWFAAIDAGRVRFRLSAYLGGFGQEEDTAKARLIFRGGGDNITGSAEMPPITALDRQGQTGLFLSQISDIVPAGTGQVFVDVIFEQRNGSYNDGYADNVELVLTESAP